ncbi:MAG: hypothetical protein ABIV10_02860 [Gemmatimonadaceae bacterium]
MEVRDMVATGAISRRAAAAPFTKKELLKECWDEQRKEISYRRDREQSIFQLSSTVWLAILGALILNAPEKHALIDAASPYRRALLSSVVLLAALMIFDWLKNSARRAPRVNVHSRRYSFSPGVMC